MRVVMLTHELPSQANANTIAPIAVQIESLRKCGVDIEVVQLLGRKKIKYLQTFPRFQRSIRSDVDLVHAHYGFCGMLARTQWRKPLVVSFMGSDLLGTPDHLGRLEPLSRVEMLANRCLARFVDAVIVKSPEMARVLSPIQAHIVPNGVDLELFHPIEKVEAMQFLGWRSDRHYVLFPGNPQTPRKGYPFAEEAIRLAEEKINETIEIKTLYHVPHRQVPWYMNACDLVMMTSYIEGSPNVIKEAMACNRPVVGVPVGDVVELLQDVPGCTIVQREVIVYSDALVTTLRGALTAQRRDALIKKGLDIESVARKIIGIYDRAIRKSHS